MVVAVLLVLLAAIAVVMPAGAASPKKLYYAADTDAGDGVSLTIYNEYASQPIGSANIMPTGAPAGFSVTGATFPGDTPLPSCGGVANPPNSCFDSSSTTYPGGRVVLRNASIGYSTAPSPSNTVKIVAISGGCNVSVTWSVIAKQANDFGANGTGNDFTYDARQPAAMSKFGGGCKLIFSDQPADSGVYPSSKVPGRSNVPTVRVVKQACEPGVATTPNTGDCAALTALDGTGVTVALSSASALDTTSTTTATLSSGEASFSNLRVKTTGTSYTLTASTASPSLSVTSSTFNVRSDLCTRTNTCQTTYANPGNLKALTQIQVDTSSDQNVITLNPFDPSKIELKGCSGSKTFTPDGGGAEIGTTNLPDLTVVTFTYNKQQRQLSTDNGIGNYNLCFTGVASGDTGRRFPVQTQFDGDGNGLSNTVLVNGIWEQQGVVLGCSSPSVHAPGWVNTGSASLAKDLLYPCEASSASTSSGGAVVVGYSPAPWDLRWDGG